MVPAFVGWPDQRQLESTHPGNAAAEPGEHRSAIAPVSCVGFGTGRRPSVRIGGSFAQADQIEHVDGPSAVVVAELGEYFLGRIDVTCHRDCLTSPNSNTSSPGMLA